METERIRTPLAPGVPSSPREADRHRPRPRRSTAEPPVAEILPAEAPPNAVATGRSAQVWLPTIAPQRRQMLLELHRHVAASLSHELRDRLRQGDQLSFEGMGLAQVRELCAQDEPGAVAGVFAIPEHRIIGFALIPPALAAYFARTPYGIAAAENPEAGRALTRLEMMIAGRALDDLLGYLGTSYAAAGLGSLQRVGRGEALAHNPRFNPDDYMVVFRFRVGAADSTMELTIAAGVDLINLCHSPTVSPRPPVSSPAMTRAAATVPLPAAIILGGWRVTLNELARLRPGDEIVLPEGENAWLASGRIDLHRIVVEFADGRLRVVPRRIADGAP